MRIDGRFPQTPYFTGLNEPVGQEVELKGLTVEGALPAEVRGSFFRAVPDPAYPPKFASDHTLSGDGMVSRVSFNADGTADFAIRFVETARHKAEKEVGRARFGKYRNPFTDDEDARDRPHGRQHHAGLARRPSADGEGGWAPLSRRSRNARNHRFA
jgi:carotenoid cleavage dioxygenase